MSNNNPKIIYIFSGKRKSGKDFFTDLLYSRLNPETAVVIRLSAPIKWQYAKMNNLEYHKLLDASDYKEKHRKAMLPWSEEIRNKDPGFFCRAAIEMHKAEEKPIWIVSDARRKSDLQWFKDNYGHIVRTFKLFAEEETRIARGWKFTEGIDDQETECGLDDVTEWTEVIQNSGDMKDLTSIVHRMTQDLNGCL